jgi:hypothetical protein
VQYNTPTYLDTAPNATPVADETATPRGWLEQWPALRRGLISDLFHFAVRQGASTPALVVNAVKRALRRRLQYATPPLNTTNQTLQHVWQSLQVAPQEAHAYAQTVLDWEALPYAERQQRKAERGTHYQQARMATLPVTDKQFNLLRSLGYTGEPPANRAAASTLIEKLHSERKGQG